MVGGVNNIYADFNESAINRLSEKSPELLYIGSHGYYSNNVLTAKDSLYLFGKYRKAIINEEEASMYKSGIIMDKSHHSNIMTNGLLTAKEISMLDLSNTKLACISACSSGKGKITTEGVYGLQRGFKLAGVQSLLVALWDVDDKATQILLQSFYNYLKTGKSKHLALRLAQNNVRLYEEDNESSINIGDPHVYKDPYYWAGFVLIDANE